VLDIIILNELKIRTGFDSDMYSLRLIEHWVRSWRRICSAILDCPLNST